MKKGETIALPPFGRDAELRATSFNKGDNSIEMIFSTGAAVRRYSWRDGVYYDEVLDMKPASVRLDRLNAGAPFLNTHDAWDLSCIIGSVVEGSASIRGGKGICRVRLSQAPEHEGIITNIRAGVIKNISVGYRIHEVQKTVGEEGAVETWRVTDWEPLEVSAVPIPADAGSQIRSEEKQGGERELRLAPCLFVENRSGGDDETQQPEPVETAGPTTEREMDEVITAALAARGTETPVAVAPAPTAEQVRVAAEQQARATNDVVNAALAAERQRNTEIDTIADKFGARDFAASYKASGASVQDFRSALIDHLADKQATGQENNGVRVHMGESDQEKRASAIENALLHRAEPGTNVLSAEGRNFRGMTLLEMARDFLEAKNIRTRGLSKMELAGLALQQRDGGYGGTSDFPNILANIANKQLRAGYEAMPQTFRPLVRVASVPDFKAVSRMQLGEGPALERVNEHGEFKRGSMNEGKESYSIATYGKVVGITRQVLVNDDLNAFSRIPVAFGVQAAQLESDLVWAQILANPTMGDSVALFHATHKNLMTAAAISTTSLSAGRALMALQTGLDGKTVLGLTPTYMVVPVALQTLAEQLRGQIYPAKNSDVLPDSLRNLVIIAEPRLDNGITRPDIGITVAGSASNWYLAGSPGIVDIVEMAYLDGNQGIYTETRNGFDVDGVEVKVRLDVGAKTLDWRNLAKNPN